MANWEKHSFAHLDGLPGAEKDAVIHFTISGGNLLIERVHFKFLKAEYTEGWRIPLGNILAAEIVSQKEIQEKSKSVVGRGVAGGLFFGPAGLILGGLSGAGTKQKTKITLLFVISYLSQNTPKEPKTIILNAEYAGLFGVNRDFVKELNKGLTGTEPSDLAKAYLNENGTITL